MNPLELTVVKSEVSEESQELSYYIWEDYCLKKVINLLSPNKEENRITVKGRKLKIVVKKNEEIKGSVSLNTQILPREGFQWLPLYKEYEADFLHQLKEVHGFRVLVFLNKAKQHNSDSEEILMETESPETMRFMPEIKLFSKKLEETPQETWITDRELQEVQEFEETEEPGTYLQEESTMVENSLEVLEKKLKESQEENSRLALELQETKKTLQTTTEAKEALETKVNQLQKELSSATDGSIDSSFYDSRIQKLQQQRQNMSKSSVLAELESSPHKAESTLVSENLYLRSSLEALKREFEDLQSMFNKLNKEDSLDQEVKVFLNKKGLQNHLKKVKENIYQFNQKYIRLVKNKDEILVQTHLGNVKLENFLKSNLKNEKPSPAKVNHRKKSSGVSPSKKLDTNIENSLKLLRDSNKTPIKREVKPRVPSPTLKRRV